MTDISPKGASNKNIVYIENNNNIRLRVYKYAKVYINKNETDFAYIVKKGIILYIRELLKAIEYLIKLIDSIRILSRDKLSRLFYINFLFNVIIKKSDFNVYLL